MKYTLSLLCFQRTKQMFSIFILGSMIQFCEPVAAELLGWDFGVGGGGKVRNSDDFSDVINQSEVHPNTYGFLTQINFGVNFFKIIGVNTFLSVAPYGGAPESLFGIGPNFSFEISRLMVRGFYGYGAATIPHGEIGSDKVSGNEKDTMKMNYWSAYLGWINADRSALSVGLKWDHFWSTDNRMVASKKFDGYFDVLYAYLNFGPF